jgi:hypothetical protein
MRTVFVSFDLTWVSDGGRSPSEKVVEAVQEVVVAEEDETAGLSPGQLEFIRRKQQMAGGVSAQCHARQPVSAHELSLAQDPLVWPTPPDSDIRTLLASPIPSQPRSHASKPPRPQGASDTSAAAADEPVEARASEEVVEQEERADAEKAEEEARIAAEAQAAEAEAKAAQEEERANAEKAEEEAGAANETPGAPKPFSGKNEKTLQRMFLTWKGQGDEPAPAPEERVAAEAVRETEVVEAEEQAPLELVDAEMPAVAPAADAAAAEAERAIAEAAAAKEAAAAELLQREQEIALELRAEAEAEAQAAADAKAAAEAVEAKAQAEGEAARAAAAKAAAAAAALAAAVEAALARRTQVSFCRYCDFGHRGVV